MAPEMDPTSDLVSGRRRSIPKLAIIGVLIGVMVAVSAALLAERHDPNYLRAEAEASRMLELMKVPPHSIALSTAPTELLSGPAGQPSATNLVDKFRWWDVDLPWGAAVGWFQSHPPKGLELNVTGSGGGPGYRLWSQTFKNADTNAYVFGEGEVSITGHGAHRSWVRTDGIAVWVSSAPIADKKTGQRLRVTMRGGCPRSLQGYVDISNPSKNLATRMLPDATPVGGMICRYGPLHPGIQNSNASADLGGVALLPMKDSSALARAINHLILGTVGGIRHGCLALPFNNVLVFKYRGRPDVDIWAPTSACIGLDNGYIYAGSEGNSALGDFFDLMKALTR